VALLLLVFSLPFILTPALVPACGTAPRRAVQPSDVHGKLEYCVATWVNRDTYRAEPSMCATERKDADGLLIAARVADQAAVQVCRRRILTPYTWIFGDIRWPAWVIEP
jgi:hypothetical protein